MTTSRSSTTQILEKTFIDKEEKKSICGSTVKYLSTEGSESRIFDDFPCLLPKEDIQKFCSAFKKILSYKEKKISTDNDGIQILSNKCENAIKNLHDDIIKIAKAELLDENSKVKQKIVKLLGWENYQGKINSTHFTSMLICAFVSSADQHIMKESEAAINKNKDKASAMFLYINRNLNHWIAEQYGHSKYNFNCDFNKYLKIPNKTTSPEALFYLTAITVVTSVYFFNKDTPQALEEPEAKEGWLETVKSFIGF